MDKEFLKTQMMRLETNYGAEKFKITKELFLLWFDMLHNLNEEGVKASIDEYIRTREYPPTIASILNIYNEKANYRKNLEKYLVNRYKWACGWINEKPTQETCSRFIRLVCGYPKENRENMTEEIIRRVVGYYNDCITSNIPSYTYKSFEDVLGEFEWMQKNN